MMKPVNKKWIAKTAMAVTIGFTAMFSGTMLIPAHQAYAYSASKASQIVTTSKKYLKTPYRFGAATGQSRNFDCSAFTQFVFAKYGIDLPRESKDQAKKGTFVAKKDLKPGDLVFFYSPIHHVGIYIGGGKIIHTYGDPGVTISDITSGWWSDHYKTARRVL
ncbi:Murein DD-endopeptidase MepS/Murein LD-carboxypeptidase precursor [Paenibacillus konkukensis]|uniref:Murein DD-endopeptidase MepS/Murein LD-carboxypeptidase n=1 Tax=Paenibacillus konkukensis TaxID=2020716 RepID=A0ABY4RUH3_9BACL|nr:C40 family peptidase [Paenibacillus konkukensis]UQZ85286.1 Murein DD-endopeptidase MepS/Murein LD-carboxypeptidase precursor [Paenibacillus konkukensis]